MENLIPERLLKSFLRCCLQTYNCTYSTLCPSSPPRPPAGDPGGAERGADGPAAGAAPALSGGEGAPHPRRVRLPDSRPRTAPIQGGGVPDGLAGRGGNKGPFVSLRQGFH